MSAITARTLKLHDLKKFGLQHRQEDMLATPKPEQPTFGLVLNGSEFLFLKLVHGAYPQYAMPDLFSLLNRGNQLYEVFGILKYLGAQISATSTIPT